MVCGCFTTTKSVRLPLTACIPAAVSARLCIVHISTNMAGQNSRCRLVTVFTPRYYQREIPVWATYDKEGMLGEAGAAPSFVSGRSCWAFLLGVVLGRSSVVLGVLRSAEMPKCYAVVLSFCSCSCLCFPCLLERRLRRRSSAGHASPHHHAAS